jgi:AcrR family transcriptional regulator
MKKETNAANTRQTIIQAACQIILEQGVNHLTLEAVAAKAGISKGGLLYHFHNKDALVIGMVDYLNDDFGKKLEQQIEPGDSPGKNLRAYVQATFEDSQQGRDLYAGLMAAITTNPDMLESIRQSYRVWQEQLEQDGIDPSLATIIRLAADGLWVAELLEMGQPTGELREKVRLKLLELSRG